MAHSEIRLSVAEERTIYDVAAIDRAMEEIGRTGAHLLIDRLTNGADGAAQRIFFPTRLIMGGSCAPVKT